MKKIILGLLALSTVAMAKDGFFDNTNIYVTTGIDVSQEYPVYTEINGTRPMNTSDAEDIGYELTLEGTKEFGKYLELGLGVSYQDHSLANNHIYKVMVEDERGIMVETDEYYNNIGFRSVPIYAVGKINIDIMDTFTTYLKVDLGYSINSRKKDLTRTREARYRYAGEFENYATNMSNGLYYGVGIGIDYENLIVEAMYKVNKGEIKFNNYTKDIEYSRITLAFGYKLDF